MEPFDLLKLFTQYAAHDQRQAIMAAEEQVLRALRELCGDVEPYQPGWKPEGDVVALMLVGTDDRGILDASIDCGGEDPVITMELMPVRDAPVYAEVTDAWGEGERGQRDREQRWTFGWGGEPKRNRRITYAVPPDGRSPVGETAARKAAALKLASLAGWPLPPGAD